MSWFLTCAIIVYMFCFFSSRRRHTRCALVTGVQTCALPICCSRCLKSLPHPTAGWQCRSGEPEVARAERPELAFPQGRGHLGEARRRPPRPVVLVDQQRADSLVEVLAGHEGLAQAVLLDHRLVEIERRALLDLGEGHLEAGRRLLADDGGDLRRPIVARLVQGRQDRLDRGDRKGT